MSAENDKTFDALIIGGGFYGCVIAIYLAKERGFKNILLVENEAKLLQRASYTNQARVHNGYHYPRSFTTAYRSRLNLPRFIRDWPEAVRQDFTKLYAIARRNSKVTAKQFQRFCLEIGAKIAPASKADQNLFDTNLIEAVFEVEEFAFNTTHLAEWATDQLARLQVNVELSARVTAIRGQTEDQLQALIQRKDDPETAVTANYIFNCTYSGINQFQGDFGRIETKVRQEITEMALVKVPPHLKQIGVTVMDGPFFSMMPFPARDLHTLSHVRYTPHVNWADENGIDPYAKLKAYAEESRFERMIRDISRYMPSAAESQQMDSIFEVKTILEKNEIDDGRPILFERHPRLKGCYSVLGGKIDNIYDVLEKLDTEPFDRVLALK